MKRPENGSPRWHKWADEIEAELRGSVPIAFQQRTMAENEMLRYAIREINALWIAHKLADLPTAIRNAYALLEKGNE